MGRFFLGVLRLFGGRPFRPVVTLEPVIEAEAECVPAEVPAEPTKPIELDWLGQLDAALDAAGVVDFTARELTYLRKAKPPRHDEPPRELWPALVAVAVLAQEVRYLYGRPLVVSSCWRPD